MMKNIKMAVKEYRLSIMLFSGLLLCSLFFMAACGTSPQTGQPENPAAAGGASGENLGAGDNQDSSNQALDNDGQVFPFELITYNDAVVTFTHVPERVLAANPNAGEELMALGLGDRIIATSYNNAQVAAEYRAEYEAKPSLTNEGQPSLEIVLDLGPDFIYGRSSAFGTKGIADHNTLTEHGIMSLASIEGYKLGADVEDVYQDFYNLGRIFQVEDKAAEIVQQMQERINQVAEKVKGREPVKVFNFDMEMEGGAYTPGNNFTSKLIRRAGGINIFEDLEKTWNTVSWEAVLEADPDVIIINDYGTTTLEEKIQLLKTNPALSSLKAVQEDRFLAVTLPEVFASARVADTVEKFGRFFHPEAF